MNKEYVKAIEDLRRELRAELRGFKDSVKYCSDTCDGVNEISKDIKQLRKEMQEMMKKNNELREENNRLSLKVEELEQYQRSNNLEIKGLPLDGDETDIIKKLGDAVHVTLTDTDIDICHRVATAKPEEKNVVVRFVRRSKRNAVLAAAKKTRLSAESLGFEGNRTPVYVNEHLTRQNKKLLGAAVARKKQNGWKFVWTAGGKVFARKSETSSAVKIACPDDLGKIN